MKQFVLLCLIISAFSLIQANDDEEQEVQEITPFIGNGSVSLQMSFMVSIRRASEELTNVHFGNGHVCGGVILTRTHILTAASCIQIKETRVPTDDILVIAGTRYRYDNAGVESSVAKNISIHPGYTFDPLNNNLAIIEVKFELLISSLSLTFASSAQHNTSRRCFDDFTNRNFKFNCRCGKKLSNFRVGITFIGK
jgi:secreted trypsin-like serine protease